MRLDEAWNWLYRISNDFAGGTRDITVLPDHLRNAKDDYLERVARWSKKCHDNDMELNSTMSLYYVKVLREIRKRQSKQAEAIKPVKPPKPEKQLRSKVGYVYLIQSPTGHYKIGQTINPDNRMRTFHVRLPFEIEYVCCIQTEDRFALESELHHRFTDKRVKGEWFALQPEDVEYIKGLAK